VTITRRSSLAGVAAVVAGALGRAEISAVLTGGACATIYTRGAYQSHDLDFIVRRGGTRKSLDDAMASIGFTRNADRYVHPETDFFVEFPRGPLAIGDDVAIAPVGLKLGREHVLALSPTDSCRDRLAAFYHWSDRQSLSVAVEIACTHPVNMRIVRGWSIREGFDRRFEEFERELVQRRRRHKPRRKRTNPRGQ
jgi:hypothetical protein